MHRRNFLLCAAAVPLLQGEPPAALKAGVKPGVKPGVKAGVKLGIDLFSLRSQGWTPFQYLDYCARQHAKVVHFSEIRFIGSLDPENLKLVRRRAEELGIEIEIGMKSICPTSKMFDPKEGTAEQQLGRMIDAANQVGSKIVRAVLGSMDDRHTAPIEKHIESTVQVLKNMRSKASDNGIRIAIENHAGDMQGHELKMMIEEAGPDFVGACLDSGNPLWTLEDPHVTLEALAPYVLTSHVRDSAVWNTAEGAAVSWVRMGQGNVDIDAYVKDYAMLCPGRALSMECIVFGPRMFPYRDNKFWEAYRDVPAWGFERFVRLSERGKPRPEDPWETPNQKEREREDLEASLDYTKRLLGLS